MENWVITEAGQASGELGGKALQLLRMREKEMPVPAFFVLPWASIARPMRAVFEQVENIVEAHPSRSAHAVAPLSARLQHCIRKASLPQDWLQGLQAMAKEHFGEAYEVAVRSSVEAEDGDKASFAGLHHSALYIGPDRLEEALKTCIASAWSTNALAYRCRLGLPLKGIRISLVIQEMVTADRSGVAFSMNTQGNLADTLVVAGYGAGTGVVDGRVPTDTFWVNRKDQAVRQRVADKGIRVVRAQSGMLEIQPVEPARQRQPVLTEPEAEAVAAAALKVEAMLGKPADLEFAFTAAGQLWLLQARPITIMPEGNLIMLDNTNIVESYPGLTLPLSFTFARWAYEEVFRGSARAFRVNKRSLESLDGALKSLIAHFHGRVYYRLDHWYRIMAEVYSSNQAMDAWEEAVGLSASERRQVPYRLQSKLKTIWSGLWQILNLKRGNQRFFRAFDQNNKKLEDLLGPAVLTQRSWGDFEGGIRALFRPWYQTLVNDFIAFQAVGWLRRLIRRWLPDAPSTLANDLLCDESPTTSEQALLHTLELKEMILHAAALKALFEQPAPDIWAALQSGAHPSFHSRLEAHLQVYGHRTLAELKLETPSFIQRPALYLELLKQQLKTKDTAADLQQRQRAIREAAQETLSAQLSLWHPIYHLLKVVRRLARYSVSSRENMRFCRTRGYGTVKMIFSRFGRQMVDSNVIDEAEDIFYLDLEVVRDYWQGGKTEGLQQLVKQRKAAYEIWAKEQLPGRIICTTERLPQLVFPGQLPKSKETALSGVPVSGGVVTALALVLHDPDPSTEVNGRILVTPMTDPGWVFLMIQATGLVSEQGSLLSHTAIVGRELGIPVVVGVKGATRHIKTGERITLDGQSGELKRDV